MVVHIYNSNAEFSTVKYSCCSDAYATIVQYKLIILKIFSYLWHFTRETFNGYIYMYIHMYMYIQELELFHITLAILIMTWSNDTATYSSLNYFGEIIYCAGPAYKQMQHACTQCHSALELHVKQELVQHIPLPSKSV